MTKLNDQLVLCEITDGIDRITLNDRQRRNALSLAMFDALDAAVQTVSTDETIRVLLLRGEGGTFCAGFDLKSAADDPPLIGQFIHRLSHVNRALRRLPCVVIAAVDGAAVAGGCAMLSACDMVIAAPDATFGYPVHRIGVSPAVTIPTLAMAIGDGPARTLLMSGELIDGKRAYEIGLATHLAASAESLHTEAEALAGNMAAKPPHALRVIKAWSNEIDGSLDDARFDGPANGSASLANGDEAAAMLRAFWHARSNKP